MSDSDWFNLKLYTGFNIQKLNIMYPTISPECNRYKMADGSQAHLFWVCHLLNGFWSSIYDWFSKVYSRDIPLDPKLTLLGCSEVFLDCTLEEQQTLMLGMVVAKKIILLDWKTSSPPCFKKWLNEMISVIHSESRLSHRFLKIWDPFLNYIRMN